MRRALCLIVVALAACGRVPNNEPQSQPGQAVLSASGRVKGGRFTMDVQLGQPVQAAPATGGVITVEPGAAR
jgi:hypothetical protein